MYQVIKKIVRPDETVEFPFLPAIADPAHLTHLNVNYEQTGKNIFREAEQGATPLERIITMFWDTKESYDEYMADPVIAEMRTAFSQVIADRGMTEETVSLTQF